MLFRSIPDKWYIERFQFPLDFAPQIHNVGFQDVRFPPGWGEASSEDYWSYMYMWWLEGNPKFDTEILKGYLNSYYTGLVGRNIVRRNIPQDKLVQTSINLKRIKAVPGDIETYTGDIRMLDYMTLKPIVLNTIIHIKDCELQKHKVVFIEISPNAFTHSIWKRFNQIEAGFECIN